MKRLENILGHSEIDQEQLRKTGEAICDCCNGTGLNPEYRKVHIIQTAINELPIIGVGSLPLNSNFTNTNVLYCLNCYGMGKIDWIQYATGKVLQEIADKKNEMRGSFLRDVDPFLTYIHFSETWCKDLTLKKYHHYDIERNIWIEADKPNYSDISSLRAAYKWLNKFKADGYFDPKSIRSVAKSNELLYWIGPDDYMQEIKEELIRSSEMSIDRLLEIKEELDLFWYDITDLDDMRPEDNIEGEPPMEYVFTWENFLKEFNLPLTHLDSFESKEANSTK